MNKHTNHGKQLPQVLIVGEVSENFSAAYEELLKLESQGEVFIDSLSMLTYNTTTGKIHKHPHWHKNRW